MGSWGTRRCPPALTTCADSSRTIIIIVSYKRSQIRRSRLAKTAKQLSTRVRGTDHVVVCGVTVPARLFDPWTLSSSRPAARQHRQFHPHRHHGSSYLHSVDGAQCGSVWRLRPWAAKRQIARFQNNQKHAKGLPMSKRDSRRAKIRAGQKHGSAESTNGIDQKEKTMERRILERRSVLKGGMAAAGMLGSGASTATVAGVKQAAADAAQSPLPEQILSAFERFRSTIPANFDRKYVEKAVIPFFLTSFMKANGQCCR